MSNFAKGQFIELLGRTLRLGNVRQWCEQGKGRLVLDRPPRPLELSKPHLFGSIARPTIVGQTELPERYVAELTNCRILGGTRLIFVNEDFALHDEMVLPYADQYGVKLAPLFKAIKKASQLVGRAPAETRHIDEGILVSCDYDRNYFHWMIECLPKFLLAESCSEARDLPLIIDRGLHDNMVRALQYLNKGRRPIVLVDRGEIISVGRLIVPSDVSRLLDNYDYPVSYQRDCVFDAGAIREVSSALIEAVPPPKESQGRGIYINRRNAAYRKPTNEEELISIAGRAGLDIVEIEGLSLEEQIRLFHSAKLVVNPTGSSCTNIIFSRPGTNILIMTSNDPNSNFQIFHQVANAVACKATYLVCQRDMKKPHMPVHSSYYVDPAEFTSALTQLSQN